MADNRRLPDRNRRMGRLRIRNRRPLFGGFLGGLLGGVIATGFTRPRYPYGFAGYGYGGVPYGGFGPGAGGYPPFY